MQGFRGCVDHAKLVGATNPKLCHVKPAFNKYSLPNPEITLTSARAGRNICESLRNSIPEVVVALRGPRNTVVVIVVVVVAMAGGGGVGAGAGAGGSSGGFVVVVEFVVAVVCVFDISSQYSICWSVSLLLQG